MYVCDSKKKIKIKINVYYQQGIIDIVHCIILKR